MGWVGQVEQETCSHGCDDAVTLFSRVEEGKFGMISLALFSWVWASGDLLLNLDTC
jgi:hypothetical protein